MFMLAQELFPNARSIVGPQIREDFRLLASHFKTKPKFHQFPSGETINSWQVPDDWKLNKAYIKCLATNKIIVHTDETNLHLWVNSVPFFGIVKRDELISDHLIYHSSNHAAIPYCTTYYEKKWGFSVNLSTFNSLCSGPFEICVDTEMRHGYLEMMEVFLPGQYKEEIFFSTYLCHPSMANNELSGPILATFMIKKLEEMDRKYSYRFIFGPETIGPIFYLNSPRSRNLIKRNIHSFNLTCVGSGEDWSLLQSRRPNTYTESLAKLCLESNSKRFTIYSFSDRGSDERQYCSPGVDLDMVSIMRSKYHTYPEYHTNLDNMNLLSKEQFQETYELYESLLEMLESDRILKVTVKGEPNLNALTLKPKIGGQLHLKDSERRNIIEFFMNCDGKSLLQTASILKISLLEARKILDLLLSQDLIKSLPVDNR